MKKITIFALLLITAIACFGQQIKPSPALNKAGYLRKSKNQKITAFATLGTGVVLLASGFIAIGHTSSKGEQESKIILSGLVVSIASIPFFISSHINKKKAMAVSFKSQALPQVTNGSFVYKQIPSINFKICL